MVKVKYKFERGRVYLEVGVLGSKYYYWFPKVGLHKRFHPRQIFSRPIHHKAYRDSLISHYVKAEGWIEGELDDKIVRDKLGILILTEAEYYEQLSKAC
jgi:hypothetical protein